jgi:hypothetical protein
MHERSPALARDTHIGGASGAPAGTRPSWRHRAEGGWYARPMTRTLRVLSVSAMLLGAAASAEAGPGLRFGLTDDPDTIFVGGFYDVPLSRTGSGIFVLAPGVDLGFGDDVDFFTIRGALDMRYLVPVGRHVALYPLLGISLYYVNVDDCGADDCDDTSAGLDLGGGIRIGRFDVSLVLGIEDVPDLSLAFGFLF